MKTLHIVDGESTGGSLRQAGLGRKGVILSWRDALYSRPVPRGLTLRQLSRLRSRFWIRTKATAFDKRDSALTRHASYDEIVLWFGATSLCQLSLIQLLAWFHGHSRDNSRLSLVSAYGGWLRPEPLLHAYSARRPITPAQMRLACKAWLAFSAPSPKPLSQLLRAHLRALPEIRQTITSMLQEYPERQTGLSRLERKMLRIVDSLGVTTPALAVRTTLQTELVADSLLFDFLSAFLAAPHPLLSFAEPFKGKRKGYRFNGSKIEVTDTGLSVLAGKADHIALNGIDRWIGGVHLHGHRVQWRWDDRIGQIVSQPKVRRG